MGSPTVEGPDLGHEVGSGPWVVAVVPEVVSQPGRPEVEAEGEAVAAQVAVVAEEPREVIGEREVVMA